MATANAAVPPSWQRVTVGIEAQPRRSAGAWWLCGGPRCEPGRVGGADPASWRWLPPPRRNQWRWRTVIGKIFLSRHTSTGRGIPHTLQEGTMAIETVGFAQIATAATPNGPVLYGLTAGGEVYEYNYSREVWIPVLMRALPGNGLR